MAKYFNLLLQLSIFFQIIFSHITFIASITPSYNSSGSRPQCVETERQALLHFKGNLTDSFGRLSSWVGQDCCNWAGVGCNNHTGYVVKLDLGTEDSRYQVSGMLSSSLHDLNHLNYLNLSGNDIGGMVPPQLGNLSNLHYLDLSFNYNLASDLNWLSGLTCLEYLNLNIVNLSKASASLPKAISFLPSLSELHLQFCSLEYPISLLSFSTANFTSLSVIDLSYNELILEMPPWLMNITTLVYLDLSRCNITAPVSYLSWYNLHNLEVIDLYENSITDNIGTFIEVLSKRSNSSLRILGLWSNHFSGQLGGPLGRLTCLTSLFLNDNSISGEIPSSIGRLLFLEELAASNNLINGSIPESFGRLSSLSILYLSNNKMTGYIPKSFGKLSSLTDLDLAGNYWKGKLYEVHLKKLRKLKSLEISSSYGALVFDMARDWIPPFSLEQINITGCQLGPAFPRWIESQKELISIVLSNAQISDTIPDWFWNLVATPELEYLDLSRNGIGGVLPSSLQFEYPRIVDLSHNHLDGPIPLWSKVRHLYLRNNSFSGPIPTCISTIMPSLQFLDLSSNFLNGTIPKSISTMKDLIFLDLSNNRLSGKMLTEWDSLGSLGFLDLSKNNLFGEIPQSICSINVLSWLDLSDNILNGAVPLCLQNCSFLEGLNLGGNRLSGNIPGWKGNQFAFLELLNLGMNRLDGEIPEELCHVPLLHALDLSHNNLSGTIPPCFGNLSRLIVSVESEDDDIFQVWTKLGMDFVVKGMRYDLFRNQLSQLNVIDLSGNTLTGVIPEGIANLLLLDTLNFSQNQLRGIIPEKIGTLRQLETLDLSHNHLSGPIPVTMVSLTMLSHLDLSFNNFSGQIPRANQFSTFSNSIYEGNPMLCGDPLPKSCFTRASEDSDRDKDEKRKGGKRADDDEMFWFYVSLGMGFIVGFWGLLGSLAIKRSWRIASFRYFDEVTDRIFVFIAVKIARLKQTIESEEN